MSFNITAYQKSLKLGESELLPLEKACLFCGSADRVPVFILQAQPEVVLLKCRNCNAYSASRMPTQATIFKYYNSYYDSEIFQKTGEQVTSDDSNRQSILLAKKIKKYNGRSDLRILDFGGGDGTISVKMALHLVENNSQDIEIVVVDFNEKVIAPTDKRIAIYSRKNLSEISGEFDIVLASAILEHLTNPQEIIKDLLQRLKVNGIFYARTPSVAPVIRVFGLFGIGFDFTYPGHLHDMGQKFWENYLSKCLHDSNSFTVLESRPSIAETTFKTFFFRTLVSNIIKLPWYVLGNKYQMVGGWTILIKRVKKEANNLSK